MKTAKNVVELIGNTPVVKLNKLIDENMADVYVKLEYFNPGGSVKDRIAKNMIEVAEKQGLIKADSVIIEPTSGNTGIGLAMIAAAKGYKMILVMPETMSMERKKLMAIYGAQLVLTPGALGMKGAIDKAVELVKENSNYFMPMQFENPSNPATHETTTALEILQQMDGKIDAFVSAVGTGGTITGTGKILKQKIKDIKVIAVEPEDSPVLSGGKPGKHAIQGIGAGFIPAVLDVNIYDEIIKVSNKNAIETARKLASSEGLLLGISSGAAVFAAIQVAIALGKGKTVLAIAPDTGERYISTDMFADM